MYRATRNDYATMADEGSNPLDSDTLEYLPVAQLDSASDSDSEGRRFESFRAGQKNSLSPSEGEFFSFFQKTDDRWSPLLYICEKMCYNNHRKVVAL